MDAAPSCAICKTTKDLAWCSTCRVYLCPRCRGDWPARVWGAAKKFLGIG
jgi:Zn-finger nucleic acid-binding protein